MTAKARVVVIGSGFAGICAAWAANSVGAHVTLIQGRPGASSFHSGAFDYSGWSASALLREDMMPLSDVLMSSISAMQWPVHGGFSSRKSVVSSIGTLRQTRVASSWLLTLPLDMKEWPLIVVPELPIGSWSARSVVARMKEDIALLHRTTDSITYYPCEPRSLLFAQSDVVTPLADIAASFDVPERQRWLAERLRMIQSAFDRPVAILLPPILGTKHASLEAIRGQVPNLHVGECLSEFGGPQPFRYAHFLKSIVDKCAFFVIQDDVVTIEQRRIRLTSQSIDADQIVLACGGILSGGLSFGSKEHRVGTELPSESMAMIRSPFFAGAHSEGVAVWMDQQPFLPSGSLFGQDADQFLVDNRLLRAGLQTDSLGRVLRLDRSAVPWLFAAGDLVSGAPRTALAAMESGLQVGFQAAKT